MLGESGHPRAMEGRRFFRTITSIRIGDLAVVGIAVLLYLLGAELEAFEAFYDFSREHEDWDLDEIALSIGVALLTFPILVWRANRRLRASNLALAEARQRAFHNARVDPLTGLWNRRSLVEKLEGAPEGGEAAVLLLDLDRFKPINDLRGHAAGDLLLIALSDRLAAVCKGRAEAFRLGGDEFAVLVKSGLDEAQVMQLAQDISDAISQPVEIDHWWAECGCSIGVSDWRSGMDPMRLLREADQAMYAAKEAGRGRIVAFDIDMGIEAERRASLEEAFEIALTRGDVIPHYQPYFDIETGALAGVEILARWTDPYFGPVDPGTFVRIAEDLGLIDRMTDQVLDQACRDMGAWPSDTRMSLNLSPTQFCDEGLPARLLGILDRYGISPARLEIEITESAVFSDQEMARNIIDALVSEGVGITLDDFGTGTSSLTMLAQVPFSKLKIDRSFVSGVETSPQSAKIVSSVLSLAQSLELDVTAEGVERPEELDFLRSHNCGYGQGFLLSRPLPAAALSELISGAGESPGRASA